MYGLTFEQQVELQARKRKQNMTIKSTVYPGVLLEVGNELNSAREHHADMHSAHEGWAVIKEELDELWEEVRTNTHNSVEHIKLRKESMRAEALQVAAMAIRFIEDVCDKS